jgi:hypothetical protein
MIQNAAKLKSRRINCPLTDPRTEDVTASNPISRGSDTTYVLHEGAALSVAKGSSLRGLKHTAKIACHIINKCWRQRCQDRAQIMYDERGFMCLKNICIVPHVDHNLGRTIIIFCLARQNRVASNLAP